MGLLVLRGDPVAVADDHVAPYCAPVRYPTAQAGHRAMLKCGMNRPDVMRASDHDDEAVQAHEAAAELGV